MPTKAAFESADAAETNMLTSAWDTAHNAGIAPSFEETERRLNAPIRLIAISAKTRRFYQTYRWQGRYKTLRHWVYIVALMNILCGAVDYLIVDRRLFAMTIVARVIISTSFLLGGLALYRLRRPEIEGLSILGPCIVLFMATGIVGLHSSPELLERYIVNAWFVVGSGVVFLRLDFLYTCLLTAASLLILPIFIMASAIHPDMAKVEIVLFHTGAMLALWNAQRIQMAHRYRGILLSLKNELQAKKLGEQAILLRDLAATDQLTGIANRRCFNETCAALAPDLPIAVTMIDIDHFKALNDSLGHIEGDRAIRLIANAISATVRQGDLVARYGGEEFVVLARHANLNDTVTLAEQIRYAVATLSGPCGYHLTVSIGVAAGYGAEQVAVLRKADTALYAAKNLGRDRVVVAGAPAAKADADRPTPRGIMTVPA